MWESNDTDEAAEARDDGGPKPTAGRRPVTDGGLPDGFFETVSREQGAGLAVYEPDGRITYVNDAFADLVDRDRVGLVGAHVWAVSNAVTESGFDAYWESVVADGRRREETTLTQPDDTDVPVVAETTALEADGEQYHALTAVEDAARSDPPEAVSEIDWAELERNEERVERFASLVSHDLRNPLNVAMGRLRLAQEDCDSEHLESVADSLDRMETLLDDVVTLAREGHRVTDPQPVALAEVARNTWEATGGPDAAFTAEGDPGTIRADSSRLSELLENLFRNAVEHTDGAVTVAVGPLADGRGFYVADDGPGIDPDRREQVFDAGYTTADGGTGFGLAIVVEIAEAHGWEVDLVESAEGGARFEFRGVETE